MAAKIQKSLDISERNMLTYQQINATMQAVDKSTFFVKGIFMITRFEHFSSSVSCIYRHIQKTERMEMEKYGLKGPHAQCLLAMSRYPEGITASTLCTVCDKDKAAVSRTVAELEREGLVLRQTRGTNRYRALLQLTEQGKTIAARVDELAGLAVEKASGTMSDEQRFAMYAALDLIARNLQTICHEGLV